MLGNATFALIDRFDGIGREPSGLNCYEHRMLLRASTRMLARHGGSSTYLGY
jgi:hypothetical protein